LIVLIVDYKNYKDYKSSERLQGLLKRQSKLIGFSI